MVKDRQKWLDKANQSTRNGRKEQLQVSNNLGVPFLERIIFFLVFTMSIALFVQACIVGVNGKELIIGWMYGFTELSGSDLFSPTGIFGSVVISHNHYLHTVVCQSSTSAAELPGRHVPSGTARPIVVSFIENMAVDSIAAERVYGTNVVDEAGSTNFCDFQNVERLMPPMGYESCVSWTMHHGWLPQHSVASPNSSYPHPIGGHCSVRYCQYLSSGQLNLMVNFINSSIRLSPFAFSRLVN